MNEIKVQVTELKGVIDMLKADKLKHKKIITELNVMIANQYRKIGELQNKCSPHTFEGKPNGIMGRGRCDNCGKNDY